MKKTIITFASMLAAVCSFALAVPSNPRAIELSLSGPAPAYNTSLPQGSPGLVTVQVMNAGSGNPMPVNTFTVDISVDATKIPFDFSSGPVYDVTSNNGKWTVVSQSANFIKLRNTNGTIAANEVALFELKLLVAQNAPVSNALAALNVQLTGGMGSQASNTIATPEDDHMDASIPITAGTPLPVAFTDFTAVKLGGSSLLDWSTATELNNDHFDIERSGNGKSFTRIGVVTGSGTSSESHQYHFTDEHTLKGMNYYRLNQVDKDGKSTYSKIVSLNFEGTESITFYPNPVADQLMIKGLSGGEQVIVYSASGQKMGEATVTGTSMYFSFNHLATGSYTVVVTKDGERIIAKQIVKK